MTDRAHGSRVSFEGDASGRHASLPLLTAAARLVRGIRAAALLLTLAAPSLAAQAAPRPWLDWHTAETQHFVFHYPGEFREWTLALAERIEGVRDQVARLVDYAPGRRVHVVVDDPTNSAAGTALPVLDAPTIVLSPTPPDPRSEIGNSRIWEELLATHEFAHLAHLGRPSRNRWRRLLWSLAPLPLGPIAAKSPRWAIEGYATYVEGRVTGSGRPNNAWRAAIIRQFAVEGKMPTYPQLSETGGAWETGSFAYLVGSAYLEWLARREGDSSVVALWRRMTAVTNRSFDAAFLGVYGAMPSELYARFSAEVTADALALERALRGDGLAEGTLVQRLARSTGDPAVSPDGRFVALTLRRADGPSRVVVWRTADEPDTATARRQARQRARDPLDVPDRAFLPAPKRAVISLVAGDGAPFETPRWFADNTHLLLTRRSPLRDGALRPDLYVWSAADGSLRRVTRGSSLRDADPSPDGRWAAAVRCAHGWCDLVRVDLESGEVRVLRHGTVSRNYYRPRVSRTTGEIVVAEQSNDRWRIALVSPDSGVLRYVDPDDGVTRYDATFARDGRTVIATSEVGGIANLERLDSEGGRPVRLTATTGAAVAADPAPDGSLWFLALHSKGFDLRRLALDSAARTRDLPTARVLADTLSPVLPPPRERVAAVAPVRPERDLAPPDRLYGVGPSRFRYVPATTTGFGGTTAQLAIVRSDPVGRLGIAVQVAVGSSSLPRGGSVIVTRRTSRNELTATGWFSNEAPSRQHAAAREAGLDLARSGGALRLERTRFGDGYVLNGALAALGERQRPARVEGAFRRAAILSARANLRQRDDDVRYEQRLELLGELGRTLEGGYLRQRSSVSFGAGTGTGPVTALRIAYGTTGGVGRAREQFAVGGFDSPLLDPVYDARRVSAPAYPLGSATGVAFASYRLAAPLAPFELFYDGVSTDHFRRSLRSFGVETRQRVPSFPALGTPGIDVLTGVARAVDEPAKGRWRYYVTLALRP